MRYINDIKIIWPPRPGAIEIRRWPIPLGVELLVSVPDHCLSFYFAYLLL